MTTSPLAKAIDEENEQSLPRLIAPQAAPRTYEVLYTNIIIFIYTHIAALYGLHLAWTIAKWETIIFNYILMVLGILGVWAGAHRLWSHRAYKANMPLQILLMLMFSLAFQKTVYDWVRNHRVHHRHSDTDADPHNATRGLFFSHIGWVLVKKHPEVARRGKYIDMTDIDTNPVLRFQKKCGLLFTFVIAIVLPCFGAMYFFGETFSVTWHIASLRFLVSLHLAFSINSITHKWGSKPYDNKIKPTQNWIVSLLSSGEGFHNYHHTYPWDYKAAEIGNNWMNLTTKFIDFCAWIGWAYDLKTVPDEVIRSRSNRTGDGTDLWGFNSVESKN